MILVIDYGMGNLGSILNMIKRVGGDARISSDLDEIASADKLILPGVGSFDNGMKSLNERGMVEVLNQRVLEDGIPILGICLGMQLMTNSSEEGGLQGLGWVDSKTVRFDSSIMSSKIKIPHMGWNTIQLQKQHPLFNNMDEDTRFYFVHSYHIQCNDINDVITTTNHGYDFVSSFQRNNIFGVQYHPEKSHKYGKILFENFIGSAQ